MQTLINPCSCGSVAVSTQLGHWWYNQGLSVLFTPLAISGTQTMEWLCECTTTGSLPLAASAPRICVLLVVNLSRSTAEDLLWVVVSARSWLPSMLGVWNIMVLWMCGRGWSFIIQPSIGSVSRWGPGLDTDLGRWGAVFCIHNTPSRRSLTALALASIPWTTQRQLTPCLLQCR